MTKIPEGCLEFFFSDQSKPSKYDEWSFYRKQFKDGCCTDNKGVDFLCLSGNLLWLIEVNDFRRGCQTDVVALAGEIATKVRDSLAGIAAAQFGANSDVEKTFARNALGVGTIRIAYHIEQSKTRSRLRPMPIDQDKLLDKLRRLVKAVDPHPKVINIQTTPPSVPWQVMDKPLSRA